MAGDPAAVELVATATEQHHLDLSHRDADGHNPCVCGAWWDGADGPSWDEHLAEVTVAALRDAGLMPPPGGQARPPCRLAILPREPEVRIVPVPYDPRTGRMLG